MADKMVTLAKEGTLHHRRQAFAYLKEKDVVRKLFDEFPKRFAARHGGYTTYIRLPERKGDGAPMCFFMYLDGPAHKKWLDVQGKEGKTAEQLLSRGGQRAPRDAKKLAAPTEEKGSARQV